VPLLVMWEAVATARAGGGAATGALSVARTTGVAGVEMIGSEVAGRDERASKSERWFAKVFWD
jgi:hypothetical protein